MKNATYLKLLLKHITTRTSLTAIMKYLVLALLLCALLSLSNASCYRKATNQVFPTEKPMTHCQDDVDGTWHAVGSTWRNSECMDCTCEECCTAYMRPVAMSEDCESVFDSKACKYIVHKRGDPNAPCSYYSSVGK